MDIDDIRLSLNYVDMLQERLEKILYHIRSFLSGADIDKLLLLEFNDVVCDIFEESMFLIKTILKYQHNQE